eukprot:10882973-Heterocapsa_arctica.AAC.1
MDRFVPEGDQAARKEKDEHSLSHVELQPRHNRVLFKSGEDLISHLVKVGNHQRSVISKCAEERMALIVREYKFPMEPTQKEIGNQDKKEGTERAALADPRFEGESLKGFTPKLDFTEVVNVQALDYQANMRREAGSPEYFTQEFL